MKPVAKCGDCGRPVNPQRGYCTHWLCHNKMLGGATPEAGSRGQKASWHSEKKRCPYCLGEAGRYAGRGHCYLSACDRGPGGKRCDCHPKLTVTGRRGVGESPKTTSSFARVVA